MIDDQADFEEDEDDPAGSDKDDLDTENMSAGELAARVKAIEAELAGKSEGKPGERKRD